MKISAIIICYNRKNDLKDCIQSVLKQSLAPYELIVVDNNSEDGTETLFSSGEISHPSIKYFKLGRNLGVAGGRNYGIQQASGEILVFLDDDALLEPETALEQAVRRLEQDREVGILAFKIINYHTNTIMRNEFPHINKSLNPDEEFETTYYIGAGHAIRKELFGKCGLYPDDFFYGGEELDLSFRAINYGYKIIYFPHAVVWHKKSPAGRMSDGEQWTYIYRNRLAIAYKYFGKMHLFILAWIWFIKIMKESRSIMVPVKALRLFLAKRKGLKQMRLSENAMKKLVQLNGRIWF